MTFRLEDSVQKHSAWKVRLRSAINARKPVDAPLLGRHDACELGCWIAGDAQRQLAGDADLAALDSAHRAFHLEAAKVAAAINAGRYDEANAMLGANSRYFSASQSVVDVIARLKRRIG